MNPATIRPLQRFRIHFEDASLAPLDVEAQNPDQARRIATRRFPDRLINKAKRVKEDAHAH